MGAISKTAGSIKNCICRNSCSQKYKVNWRYVPKDGKTNSGNAYTNCGGPGSSTMEYWAYAELNPIEGEQCSKRNCSCNACDEAKQAALDAIRPENTEATGSVSWYGPENCDTCPEPNSCYQASFGNTGRPNLPEPEHTITWSCQCQHQSES